ncbi:MAG: nucleoside-diphosphate kinase [Rickettsiaceae bacterium H1]|nr:nucleoside-diphosphate kinase [Rickettsiaceae bacterium H1]
MTEYTLSILKPDAVKRNITGKVNSYIENSSLTIVAQKRLLITQAQAQAFYYVHKDRPFFDELVKFMTSGPVIVQVLSGNNATNRYRELMGATDPKQANPGTIRGDFAESIDANCVHGSDSIENAKQEISFFFAKYEIIE